MIPFEDWGARNLHAARRLARDPEVKPLHMRVMFAAEGWANLIGHAEFAPGGLALVLQTTNPQTGEIHIPSRSQVGTAIRRAIEMGLIEESSSIRCLVPNTDLFAKTGGRGGRGCRHHRIKARKSDPVSAQTDTRDVSVSLSTDTRDVSVRHKRSVGLSVNRPISDLFLPGAPAPDPDTKTDTSERKSA